MLVPHTHTHKGVRKLKGLRLILVNSQIFNFFYGFCVVEERGRKIIE